MFDLSNAFYQILLPEELRSYFCFDAVQARSVGITHVDGYPVDGNAWIYPQMNVCPMGWSHALYVCQTAFETIVKETLPGVPLINDNTPSPSLEHGACTVYVDNFAVLSTSAEVCREYSAKVARAVHQRGLSTHEHEALAESVDLLGMTFRRSGLVTPKGDRRWRLFHAIQHLLSEGQATSRDVSVIVGHFTFMCMIRRELLSRFRAVYVFINRSFDRRRKVWPSVRRELTWARDSLCMLESDLTRGWSHETY